jgi:hypothetical protein
MSSAINDDLSAFLLGLSDEELLNILRSHEYYHQFILSSIFINCEQETVCEWIVNNTYPRQEFELLNFLAVQEMSSWKKSLGEKWLEKFFARENSI